jgi:hypothetical protein
MEVHKEVVWTLIIQFFKPNNIMLLIIMDKFDSNHVLVNVNKLKPYKYMDKEVHNQNISKFFYLET